MTGTGLMKFTAISFIPLWTPFAARWLVRSCNHGGGERSIKRRHVYTKSEFGRLYRLTTLFTITDRRNGPTGTFGFLAAAAPPESSWLVPPGLVPPPLPSVSFSPSALVLQHDRGTKIDIHAPRLIDQIATAHVYIFSIPLP